MLGPEETDSLLARVAMADRDAFETLYSRSSDMLLGVALEILDDQIEAETVLQDVFLEISEGADDLRQQALSADLALIAAVRDAAIALKRARLSQPQDIRTRDLLGGKAASKADDLGIRRSDGALRDALADVQPARAFLMERVILRGEGYNDLATATDVDMPTVRASLQKTLLTLSRVLDEQGAWDDAEGLMAAEAALDLSETDRDPPETAESLYTIWRRETAKMVLENATPTSPPEQVHQRLTARVFSQARARIWGQIWPYALGGLAAAFLLWVFSSTDLLLPLE